MSILVFGVTGSSSRIAIPLHPRRWNRPSVRRLDAGRVVEAKDNSPAQRVKIFCFRLCHKTFRPLDSLTPEQPGLTRNRLRYMSFHCTETSLLRFSWNHQSRARRGSGGPFRLRSGPTRMQRLRPRRQRSMRRERGRKLQMRL